MKAKKTPPPTRTPASLPAKPGFWSRIPVVYQLLLPGLLAFLIYANTLGHGYVLDDTLMITENRFTKQGVAGIPEIISNDALTGFFGEEKNLLPGGRYRPLSQVMFAVEYELFKLNPVPQHLINVLLYAAAIVFLFSILLRLFPPNKGPWYASLPFIVTLLFAAHPLHTEVVANIKGRDEILALWAFLGLLYFGLRYAERGKLSDLLWMLPIAFLGLLSKESAITYLAAVPVTIYFFRSVSLRRTFMLAGPILLGIAAYFLLRFSLFGAPKVGNAELEILNNPFIGASEIERIATVMLTWMKYYGLMLFPYPLTHDYYPHHLRVVGFGDPMAVLGFLITLLLLAYALWKLPGRSLWSWCIIFFFIVFSIYSNLLINIGAFMNERFVFLPLLGFIVALVLSLQWAAGKISGGGSSMRVFMSVFIVILSLYSFATIQRNTVWQSNFRLFTSDVKVSVNSAKCNVSAGEALINEAMKEGNEASRPRMLKEAERYLLKGTQLHPSYYGAWDKLSLAYVYQENWTGAIDAYKQCFRLRSNDPTAIQNLRYVGNQVMVKEDYATLKTAMRLLLDHAPDDSLGNYGMGVAWLKLGQSDSAFYYLNQTLTLAPNYADAWNKLAEAEGRFNNDLEASSRYLDKAYSLDSASSTILENKGVLAGFRSKPGEALQWFLKAYELNPESKNLVQNIITSYMILGDTANARLWQGRLAL